MPFNFKELLYRKLNIVTQQVKNISVKKDDIVDTTHWTFVLALIAILIGSVLVNLWIRVINNFTYQTLGLNQDSTIWALIIALVMTTVLVVYIIIVLDDDTGCAVKQNMTGVSFAGSAAAITGGMAIDLNTFDGN